MKVQFRIASLVFFGVAIVAMTSLAWVGDDCSNALPFSKGSIANNSLKGEALWYEFIAPETGQEGFSVRFPGTELVAKIAVYDACGGTEIASSSGDIVRTGASVTFDAVKGATYMIKISNISGDDANSSFLQHPKILACGDVGTGDCDSANGSIECDDTCTGISCPGCCATVCAADSFCCDTSWDATCASAAVADCVDVPVELQSFIIE